ncbi:MAG: DUF2723 domain-containing protein [Elusimicrobia bacterium]|nr:DUF2723 domain-containing protein [Elusimicrobiota bacterium]
MIITFLTSFGLYLFTMCPTVYSGDSGELTTACSVLGIAHPPGYPLYVLLGKIFTLIIPFGNIAYRVNLMSAFFGALSCGLVYLIVRSPKSEVKLQNIGHWTAFVTALALAFSNPLWTQSTMAEVYSFNGFFVALIIYIFLQPNNRRINPATTLLAIFLFGLGLGNHHTLVLLLPGIAYFMVVAGFNLRNKRNLKVATTILLFFLLGFSVYLYLIIRSQQNPIADWDNPENIKNFCRVVFRTGYGGILHLEEKGGFLNRPLILFVQQMSEFVRNFVKSFTIFGFIIGIFGIFLNYRQNKKSFWFLFLFFIFIGPFFIFLANKPVENYTRDLLEPFYIPSIIVFAIWIGFGIIFLIKKSKLNYVLIIGILIFQFKTNFAENNSRNNFVSFDFGKNILKTVQNNSLLFLDKSDESVFILAYQKIVEKRKTSVEIFDCNASVFPNIYGDRYYWIKGKQRTAVRLPIERKIILESKKNAYYLAENPNYFTDMKFYKAGLLYSLNKKLLPMVFGDFYVLRKTNLRYRDKIIAYSFYVSVGNYYLETNQPPLASAMYEKANKISAELR